MCFVAAHQDQSFTWLPKSRQCWGGPPRTEVRPPRCKRWPWGPHHSYQVPCDPMWAVFAKWLLASWLWSRVRANEARTGHELMGALSQRAAKLIHIDLNSLLVPRRFHAPRFAQYRDKSFNESTSHVHVSWNGLCQTATHSIHTINTSLLSLLWASSFVPSIKRSTTTGKFNVTLSTDAVLTKLLLTFFDAERNHSNVWKEMQTPGGVYG